MAEQLTSLTSDFVLIRNTGRENLGTRLSLDLSYEHFDVISMKTRIMEVVVTLLNICHCNNYLIEIHFCDEINRLKLF